MNQAWFFACGVILAIIVAVWTDRRRARERKRLLASPPLYDLKLKIDLDHERISIYGVDYALPLFRSLAFLPVGAVLQIIDRKDGSITVKNLGVFSQADKLTVIRGSLD